MLGSKLRLNVLSSVSMNPESTCNLTALILLNCSRESLFATALFDAACHPKLSWAELSALTAILNNYVQKVKIMLLCILLNIKY